MKELWKRVIVALFGAPLVLLLCYLGEFYFLFLVALISTVSLWEFYEMLRLHEVHPYRKTGVVTAIFFLLVTYWLPQQMFPALVAVTLFVFLMHLTAQSGNASRNAAYTLIGIIYIPVLLSTLLLLRNNFAEWQPSVTVEYGAYGGGVLIILTFLAIWLCDSAAYFGGKSYGRHKLSPTISPNKTVEGAVSGFLAAVLVFWGAAQLLLPQLPTGYALAAGIIVGVFGQTGDLVESRFKRDNNVKDTSSILPGHGGMLDRFDSLIFVSPFLWSLFYFGRLWS